MGNMKKRIAVFMTAMAMAATTVTGCTKMDQDAVVITVGEDKVNMGVANFFARYQQAIAEAQYGMYMGENMWQTKIADSETMEENMKKAILEDLKVLHVLEDHMKDYNVELTEEDNKKIEAAAKEFVKENGDKERKIVSGDEETVKRVLTLITIQGKMQEAMVADVDKNVSDEEAAQKSMDYVFFSFTKADKDGKTSTMKDDEKAVLKAEAVKFAQGAKTAADFKAYAEAAEYKVDTAAFDAKETSPSEDLIKAADKLPAGGVTDVIETSTGYYVAKVTSLFDKEATDAKKEKIVTERQNTRYAELVEAMLKDAKISVDKKQWEKISFAEQRVTVKQVEEKENKEK